MRCNQHPVADREPEMVCRVSIDTLRQAWLWVGTTQFLMGLVVVFGFLLGNVSHAADKALDALVARQVSLADRYEKLEELLLRLAEMEAAENPERSALLKRAAQQSRSRFVLTKLQDAAQSLTKEQLQQAVDQQEAASKELASLLKLLLTEDRSKRIRDNRERISKVVKDLKRVERAQRSTRSRTESGADLRQLEQEQGSLVERARKLAQQLSDDQSGDGEENSSADESDQDSENKNDDGTESGDSRGEPKEQPEDGEKENSGEEGESKESPQKSEQSEEGSQEGNPSKSSDGQPSEGQPSSDSKQQQPNSQGQSNRPDQPGPPKPPQQQAADQIENAVENMKQALREMENTKKDPAVEKQREAEKNLRLAIDQLEDILRQLREEERKRELAKLESRLRNMAAMQSKVLDETVVLAQTPLPQRNRQTDLKAGNLAFDEKRITMEADRALLLLREEGSSVAFPEVILQIRSDTIRITERLGKTKIDGVTQGLQEDVLAALEEMITALKQEQKEIEERQQNQPQQGQQGQQGGEEPLVKLIAELKLIRTMETRIKSTTERYDGMLQSGETTAVEIQPLLENLAERQNRLYRVTRDLVQERNK